jgi:hypothetical protein
LHRSPEAVYRAAFQWNARAWRFASIIGFVGLIVWAMWWGQALVDLELPGCALTWIHYPFLGADFTTQSDYAARLWVGGVDPYSYRDHLFHYPPLVIRLFLWTPLFPQATALRIWIVVLALLLIAGSLAALRLRRKLGLEQVPASLAVAAILLSFPAVFTLERANFDLITLAALLIALALFTVKKPWAEFVAGCILAAGPWVKLYPGIMGLGLVALRRWKVLAGFIVSGAAIGLAAPAETVSSFQVLELAVERVKNVSKVDPLPPWSHSLSVAWQDFALWAAQSPLGKPLLFLSGDMAAGLFVFVLGAWVSYDVYRSKHTEALFYPLLLWLNALGSCVGAIANDYSLMFLPLAVLSAFSLRDPWFVRISLALLLVWWQPFALDIHPVVLLFIKLLALVAMGVSLTRRARELSAGAEQSPSLAREHEPVLESNPAPAP